MPRLAGETIIRSMETKQVHSWNVTAAEAREIQEQLRGRVIARNEVGQVRLVAGLDISGVRRDGTATGAAVVLSYPELEVVEVKTAEIKVTFPYVPGLLSFREIPVVLAAWDKLKTEPDLVFVDGQGMAHPRRMGIACHLGLLLDRPTIGCAKSRLTGDCEIPGAEAGSFCDLTDGPEVIGAALRTKYGVKPLYISIGHRIDLTGAMDWCLKCCRGYRLPDPARQAHQAASGTLEGTP